MTALTETYLPWGNTDRHTGFRYRPEDRIQYSAVLRISPPAEWASFIIVQNKVSQPPNFRVCRYLEEIWIQSSKPARRAVKLPYPVVPIGWHRWINLSLVIDFSPDSSIQIVVGSKEDSFSSILELFTLNFPRIYGAIATSLLTLHSESLLNRSSGYFHHWGILPGHFWRWEMESPISPKPCFVYCDQVGWFPWVYASHSPYFPNPKTYTPRLSLVVVPPNLARRLEPPFVDEEIYRTLPSRPQSVKVELAPLVFQKPEKFGGQENFMIGQTASMLRSSCFIRPFLYHLRCRVKSKFLFHKSRMIDLEQLKRSPLSEPGYSIFTEYPSKGTVLIPLSATYGPDLVAGINAKLFV